MTCTAHVTELLLSYYLSVQKTKCRYYSTVIPTPLSDCVRSMSVPVCEVDAVQPCGIVASLCIVSCSLKKNSPQV